MIDSEALGDEEKLRQAVLLLIQSLLLIWLNLSPASLSVKRISGAMTNVVFYLHRLDSPPECDEPRQMLLRIYGMDVDWMFSRTRELSWARGLAAASIAPRWLGVFGNGRVEEFVESKPMGATMMRSPDWYPQVAQQLARIHAFVPEGQEGAPEDEIFDRVELWAERAASVYESLLANKGPDAKAADHLQTLRDLNIFSPDLIPKYRSILKDLHHGNVLITHESSQVVVIDYEYAAYAPRAYDIANIFCEFAADYDSDRPEHLDYTRLPTRETQLRFVQAYLGIEDVKDKQVLELVEHVQMYIPLVHLHWGYWGIIKSASPGTFDYLYYAVQRFRQLQEASAGILQDLKSN